MQKLVILSLIFCSLFSCKQEDYKTSDSIHAIPLDAAIIIESNNVSKSIQKLSESSFWETLSSETSISEAHNSIFTLDSNLASYASGLTSMNPVFLSLHLTGAKSFDWLIISATKNQEQKIQLLEIGLASFTKTKNHTYIDAEITEVLLEETTIYYAKHRGLLMVSEEKILIEDAIRQLKTPNNFTKKLEFNTIYNSANKKENFNLYLNTKNFDRISKAFFKSSTSIVRQAEWMQWDIELSDKGILFSGISLSHDSLAQELSFYQSNDAHATIAPGVLPRNTALFITKSFENFQQFKRKQINSNSVQQNKYAKKLAGLKSDLQQTFNSWIDSEITWFTAENSSTMSEGLVVHITDEVGVENFIAERADTIVVYRDENIYDWNDLKYLSTICFTELNKEPQYAIVLEEQLILSSDLSLLKNILNDFKSGLSIAKTDSYTSCMNKLNTNSNLFIFLQNPSALELAPKYLQTKLAAFVGKYSQALKPFKAFAIQFNATGPTCYNNAYLHFSKTETNQTRAVWTTQLEAPILSEISLVKNHYNQQWEIAVQDENYNLYLISTKGEVLWTKKLDEAIIGKLNQIDVFKNKKLQLLFNTATKIHLIDRKGRNVGNYPIELKHTTELPLALFDYQNQRNYRTLVSCGRYQYMYDKNGREIKGWKLGKTKSKAIQTAQHFVVASKDYILLPEENGTLNILNRKGEQRIKVKGKIDFSANKLHVIKGNTIADSRIVTIDKNGVQQNILFDGTIDNSIQFEFDEEIYYNFDLDHHIMIESENLKVNGAQMNLLYSFGHKQVSKPLISKFRNALYLSVTDLKNEEAYVFISPNELLEGFPVYGKRVGILRDLDLDEKLNLIIGGESGLLYNYSTE